MVFGIIRLIATAVWLAATVFLATSTASSSSALRIAAALVVGLPGAVAFARSLGRVLGRPPAETRHRVKWVLKSALIDIQRQKAFKGDTSQVSLHVWVIPLAYRKLVPPWIRRRPASKNRIPPWLRSPLVRFAMYRLEYRSNSRISYFRKGVGLVGRCVDVNKKNVIHIVRFNSAAFNEALSSEAAWAASPVEIHQHLTLEQGRELSERYSQAAAIVLQDGSDAIGCLTLDLPLDCKSEFGDSAANDVLQETLKATAESVENHLTARP
jgi:hypothetical protein